MDKRTQKLMKERKIRSQLEFMKKVLPTTRFDLLLKLEDKFLRRRLIRTEIELIDCLHEWLKTSLDHNT